jgi:hypothetical protein
MLVRATSLALLLLASPALAQGAPLPPEPPPAPVAEPTPTLSAQAMNAFLDQYLSYDEETGQATRGRAHSSVERIPFYALVGGPDLVEAAKARRNERWLFLGSAGALAAAGLIGGVALFVSAPDLASPACQENNNTYGQCVTTRANREAIGRGAIIVGGLGAGVLALLGLTLDLDPIPRVEAHRLANAYNGQLRLQLARGTP